MWGGRCVTTMYQIAIAHTYLTVLYQLYLNKAELKKKSDSYQIIYFNLFY